MCWDNLFALRRQNIVAWIAFFLWFKELQILRPALPWSALTLLLQPPNSHSAICAPGGFTQRYPLLVTAECTRHEATGTLRLKTRE